MHAPLLPPAAGVTRPVPLMPLLLPCAQVSHAVLLAPVAFVGHITSSTFRALASSDTAGVSAWSAWSAFFKGSFFFCFQSLKHRARQDSSGGTLHGMDSLCTCACLAMVCACREQVRPLKIWPALTVLLLAVSPRDAPPGALVGRQFPCILPALGKQG